MGPSSTSWRRASPRRRPDPLDSLRTLVDELPGDLAEHAFTHASWVEQRTDSYERLAFLGDVVLSLAISDHIYPRFPSWGAGRLTKLRAQAVSRLACAANRFRNALASGMMSSRRSRSGGKWTEIALMR